jgi:hypothetical protein
MSVTLEFVGGPMDGEVMAFPYKPQEWRVQFCDPIQVCAPADMPTHVRIREGVYRIGRMRREQVFRGGVQNNERRYIVDRDVMRWDGAP